MKIDTLEKLYVAQLKDLHSAERQVLKALPKMRDAATDDKLRKAIDTHLEETRGHVDRLDRIFKDLDYSPGGERCQAAAGIIEEGEELMQDTSDPRVLDAALVCAAQKFEHYEIGTYGTVRAYARILGRDEHAAILEQTLIEERKADHHLSELAEQWLNAFAAKE